MAQQQDKALPPLDLARLKDEAAKFAQELSNSPVSELFGVTRMAWARRLRSSLRSSIHC